MFSQAIICIAAFVSFSFAQCAGTIAVDIPDVRTTFKPNSIAPLPLEVDKWIYLTFKALYTNTCVQGELYIDSKLNATQLTFCDSNDSCPTSCVDTQQSIEVIPTQPNRFAFKKSKLTPGPAVLGILTTGTEFGTKLYFDGLWQQECAVAPVPHSTPATVPPKSRGVSSGLAAFLFFLGLGVAVGGMFAVQFVRNKRAGGGRSAGFVAM